MQKEIGHCYCMTSDKGQSSGALEHDFRPGRMPSSSRKKEIKLLAISCLMITQNISLVDGFQALGNAVRMRPAAFHASTVTVIMFDRGASPIFDDGATDGKVNGKQAGDAHMAIGRSVRNDNDESMIPLELGGVSGNEDILMEKKQEKPPRSMPMKRLGLMWCSASYCKDAVRERVQGNNQIILDGPATGQVAYYWKRNDSPVSISTNKKDGLEISMEAAATQPSVLLLVKPNDESLIKVAANAVKQLTNDTNNIHMFLESSLAGKLKFQYGVDNKLIHLFEPKAMKGYGGSHVDATDKVMKDLDSGVPPEESHPPYDLICTLGGDGLLMHASMLFQGPVPPIISIAGGSLGFLTQFSRDEMVDAVRIALGLSNEGLMNSNGPNGRDSDYGELDVFPPNMPSYPYEPVRKQLGHLGTPQFSFGLGDRICLSIRMRLDCRIFNPEGVCRARFNVLNEVVIDRGSSPYLAALECFCDDVHLTTVQADGVIFAT
jgi:NAD kinase